MKRNANRNKTALHADRKRVGGFCKQRAASSSNMGVRKKSQDKQEQENSNQVAHAGLFQGCGKKNKAELLKFGKKYNFLGKGGGKQSQDKKSFLAREGGRYHTKLNKKVGSMFGVKTQGIRGRLRRQRQTSWSTIWESFASMRKYGRGNKGQSSVGQLASDLRGISYKCSGPAVKGLV